MLTAQPNMPELGPRPSNWLRGRPLWWRWFTVVTAGEFLGFSVPAVVGAATVHAPAALAAVSVIAAGTVEGAVLGAAQASVLRRALDGLHRRSWTAATAAGALVAYGIGMSPSTTADAGLELPPALWMFLGPVLGLALLLTIGTAQWFVLRKLVQRAARWIGVTAGAWTVGLGVFLAFTMPLWQPGQAIPVIAAIGIGGGLLMAATTSAITGFAAVRMRPRAGGG